MRYETELIDVIKGYSSFLVYGAGFRGRITVERIRISFPNADIHVAVSQTQNGSNFCGSYQIRSIVDYKDIADETWVVLIATQEKFHNDIEETTRLYGFKSILRINEALFRDIQYNHDINSIRHDIYEAKCTTNKNIEILHKSNQFLQYQTMHAMRLEQLRIKACSGEKIKVVFLVTSEATFIFESLCRVMKKNPLFDVVLFVFYSLYKEDCSNSDELNKMKTYTEVLIQKGYNTFWGYDDYNMPIFLDSLSPDIIIYNNSNLIGKYNDILNPHGYNVRNCIANTLSCFIMYGSLIINENTAHCFENDEIIPAWKYFVGNRYEYDLASKSLVTNGFHHVLSGNPLFDPYINELTVSLPKKFVGKKKIIIFAPHWSMGRKYQITSFHYFWKHLTSLRDNNPEIGFILKPHPVLEKEIQEREKQGKEDSLPTFLEWREYISTWENSSNSTVVTDSSFIEWFRLSDCLITDSMSFILSWLPTEKPCIFLKNPCSEKDTSKFFYAHILKVLDSYYICENEHELKNIFSDVVLNDVDPKKGERIHQKDQTIYNLGNAGNYIAEYITQEIKG